MKWLTIFLALTVFGQVVDKLTPPTPPAPIIVADIVPPPNTGFHDWRTKPTYKTEKNLLQPKMRQVVDKLTPPTPPAPLLSPSVKRIAVHFSPRGGTAQADVDEIARAKKSIRVFAYSFTSQPIADALVAARLRSVDVQMVVDPVAVATGKGNQCIKAGIPVWVDHQHAIMHDKVLIIDQQTVATGSFNFSVQAEQSNAENSIVIECPALAAVYLKNWSEHQSHSVRATGIRGDVAKTEVVKQDAPKNDDRPPNRRESSSNREHQPVGLFDR